jgi:phosphomannomutase
MRNRANCFAQSTRIQRIQSIWQDGGQIVPPEDAGIIDVIENLDYNQIKFEANEGLIHYIDKDIDAAFIKSSIANASFDTPQAAKKTI